MPAIPMNTPDHLGVPESDLLAGGALWTAREIEQQPAMLERTHALLAGLQAQIDAFAGPVAQDPRARVILTGHTHDAVPEPVLEQPAPRDVPIKVDEGVAQQDTAEQQRP